jgi:hypothetical protein
MGLGHIVTGSLFDIAYISTEFHKYGNGVLV